MDSFKKIKKELDKGGWKTKQELFKQKCNNLPVCVLFNSGYIDNQAIWHYDNNWLQTSTSFENVVAWKERSFEDNLSFFEKKKLLFKKLKNEYLQGR